MQALRRLSQLTSLGLGGEYVAMRMRTGFVTGGLCESVYVRYELFCVENKKVFYFVK